MPKILLTLLLTVACTAVRADWIGESNRYAMAVLSRQAVLAHFTGGEQAVAAAGDRVDGERTAEGKR